MSIYDLKLPSIGGGATYGESNIDISKNLEISSIVSDRPFHMFVLECAKGYYYGNTSSPTYGTGNNTGDPVGELVEQIGSCTFGDLGSVFAVFQFIYQNNGTSALMQYYLLDNNSIFQDQESLKADIRLGNIETNFNLEYQIIGTGTKRSNYRISVNFDQNYATTNNQAAEMIKHTVEDLEDKQIFVVATFEKR